MGQYLSREIITFKIASPEVKVAIGTFVTSFLLVKVFQHLTSKTPPGPWGFPVIGHLPLLGVDPTVTFEQWRKKFGDVFSLRFGSWPTIVINGRRSIRDALEGDAFSGRPQFITSQLAGPSLSFGVFEHSYVRHRKLARTVLSSFTNAKTNPMVEIIQAEVDLLLEIFSARKEAPFDPHDEVLLAAGSVVFQICYGRHENIREDKNFISFILRSNEFVEFVAAGNPLDVIPWLRFVMPWKLAPFKDILGQSIAQRELKVEEHMQSFDENHLRDVTDALIQLTESGSEDVTALGKKRIFSTIDDIFGAGFGTVATTLEWALKLMASHPNVQSRIQKEIDEVVGTSRRPTLEDRGKMVYTESTLHEVMRYTSLAPLGLPHLSTVDTVINGYTVKKGTVAFINYFSMSRDPEVWGDPEVFRPERFLDSSGKIIKPLLEEFLPFGSGRRKCLGESLARMEVFLLFSGLLQRCSFHKPPGVASYDWGVTFGLTRKTKPFEITVTSRS